METVLLIISCLILVILLAVRRHNKRRRSTLPLPPGPRRLPIVGNLFSRPAHQPWMTYLDWETALNSNLMSTEIFGQTTIVSNTPKGADKLLWKRSAIYSSRPSQYMLTEVLHWQWDIGFIPYNSWWRRQRKMFHQYWNENEVPAYRPYQKRAAITMLQYLLLEPDKFENIIRHYSASVVFFVTCGYQVKANNDPLVDILYRGSFLAALFPGNFLIDYFPFLRIVPRWFPFSPFTQDVETRVRNAPSSF
ncbi:cytochrome P450 [Mucidula mucida]|nr:cytochrome P450 [Mucidula mucida]